MFDCELLSLGSVLRGHRSGLSQDSSCLVHGLSDSGSGKWIFERSFVLLDASICLTSVSMSEDQGALSTQTRKRLTLAKKPAGDLGAGDLGAVDFFGAMVTVSLCNED